jgi:hypothetical protein
MFYVLYNICPGRSSGSSGLGYAVTKLCVLVRRAFFLFGCTLIAAVIIYIVGRILIYLQANSERNDIRKQLKRLHRIEGSMKLYNL